MFPKIYNFNRKTVNVHDIDPMNTEETTSMENYNVVDYFDVYHTGVGEYVINKSPSSFVITKNEENERPEVLTNLLYSDENLSDMVLAINNRTYLWNTPIDYDTFYDIRNSYIKYIEKIMDIDMTDEITKENYVNNIKPHLEKIITDKLEYYQDNLRKVILPRTSDLEKVIKNIKDYFKSRKVN